MSLTPSEILHKEFSTKFRGYDSDEVNDFLDIVVVEFEKLTKSNSELTSKMADMEDKLNYFKQLQDSLNNSIIIAQEAAERLKQNARKEAELILYEAEREAERIVEEATNRSKSLVGETEQLHQYSINFKNRFTNMVEAQLALLNNEENQLLFKEALGDVATPLDPFKEAKIVPTMTAETEPLIETEATQATVDSDAAKAEDVDFTVIEENGRDIPVQDNFFEPDKVDETDEYPTAVEEDESPVESVLGRTIRIDLPKD